MLKHRLIFGPIMIACVLAVFWADNYLQTLAAPAFLQGVINEGPNFPPGVALCLLVLLIAPLPAAELSAMFEAKGIDVNATLVTASAVTAATALYVRADAIALGAVAILTLAAALIVHTRGQRIEGSMQAAAATLMAGAYLGLTVGCLLAMRHEHSAWTIVAIILITKSSDIGAYFTGKAIGKRKLIPWLSPGKTWEGFFGGVALAVLVAMGFAALSQSTELASVYTVINGQVSEVARSYAVGAAALGGAIIAVVAVLGDLTVSLFKRDAGLKDSGASIPGFGGVLDVLDSPLLVAPVAYWLMHTPGA
ncbi:MAG: phosphatidate cytidylyltransferase [Planctomycetota bacterium]|jgi:phosphatidate cytidylyltransferase